MKLNKEIIIEKAKQFKEKYPFKENLVLFIIAYITSFMPGVVLILVGQTKLGLGWFALFSTPIPPMFIILVIPLFLGYHKLWNHIEHKILENNKKPLQRKFDALKRKLKK